MVAAQSSVPASRNSVVVGCKLPNGLHIELFDEGQTDDGKKIFRRTGNRVLLNGANSNRNVAGFGLTDVDADFWEAWKKQNPTFPALKNGLIFGEDRQERAASHALDNKAAKTGLEPIDPDNPGKGIEKVPEKELKSRAGQN